jgi:hypothetical protein
MILRAESGSEFIEASEDSALYVLFSSRTEIKEAYHLFVKRMI